MQIQIITIQAYSSILIVNFNYISMKVKVDYIVVYRGFRVVEMLGGWSGNPKWDTATEFGEYLNGTRNPKRETGADVVGIRSSAT